MIRTELTIQNNYKLNSIPLNGLDIKAVAPRRSAKYIIR